MISANTLLGAPAEMYTYGVMYEFVCVAIVLSTVIVAIFFVPLFHPLNMTSVHKVSLLIHYYTNQQDAMRIYSQLRFVMNLLQ